MFQKNQTMIREIIKISAGSPSSYPLPSGHGNPLPGDRCEGPVRVVEGAERGEGKLGRFQHHPFPARDVRVIGREDSRSPSEIVEAMTKFSYQKPGGQLEPIFRSLPYCIFCKKGCMCLGPNCMGHEKMVPKLTLRNPPVSTKIPGLGRTTEHNFNQHSEDPYKTSFKKDFPALC